MLGVFLDALANEVKELVLFGHTYKGADEFVIRSKNIRLVDLGIKTSAWHRHLFHSKILRKINAGTTGLNALIVRAPSPLAPFFSSHISKNCLLRYYVVGSYGTVASETKPSTIREFIIKQYLKVSHHAFIKELQGKDVLVNSPKLESELEGYCNSVVNIPTTTLTDKDFLYRKDTCLSATVDILFTGRIDLQKGLMELVEAFAILYSEYPILRLHFVGWEENPEKPLEKALIKRSEELEVHKHVLFHGRKRLGEELWNMYRMADIYCIPSYNEGFPRTIWEAMANGLPVVTTPVGAVPYYLSHMENAYFINPKSVDELVQGIKTIIDSPMLRKKLISNAFEMVKENTVMNRAKQLINYLEKSSTLD